MMAGDGERARRWLVDFSSLLCSAFLWPARMHSSVSTDLPLVDSVSTDLPLVGSVSTDLPLVGSVSTDLPLVGSVSTDLPLVGSGPQGNIMFISVF